MPKFIVQGTLNGEQFSHEVVAQDGNAAMTQTRMLKEAQNPRAAVVVSQALQVSQVHEKAPLSVDSTEREL